MIFFQRRMTLPSRSRGVWNITQDVHREMPEIARMETGMLHLFLQHTSASLTVNENADPDVPQDLDRVTNAVFPESFPYRHTCEGPDDMPAHAKSSMFGVSLTIPVGGGKLLLGTWQGIFLCEHRNRAHRRSLVLTLFGVEK